MPDIGERIENDIYKLPCHGGGEWVSRKAVAHLATEAMREKDAEIERLRAACEAALEVLPGLEVRSWPPGHEMKRKAIQRLSAALGGSGEG
jgi:hypothetical protein